MTTNRKYKYWLFYINPEYINEVLLENENSNLYAYTDKSDAAKLFIKTRNMDKFILKKMKISKSELNQLAENYQRSYLIDKEYLTKSADFSKIIKCRFVMTRNESFNIESKINSMILGEIWSHTWINPLLFKDKFRNALYTIGFGDGYEMINNEIGKETVPKLLPDYISAFIHIYGNLLN